MLGTEEVLQVRRMRGHHPWDMIQPVVLEERVHQQNMSLQKKNGKKKQLVRFAEICKKFVKTVKIVKHFFFHILFRFFMDYRKFVFMVEYDRLLT